MHIFRLVNIARVCGILVFLIGMDLHAATQTRVVSYDYDADGFLTQEVLEPDDSNLRIESRWTLDTYGNRASLTVTSRSGSRSSSTSYDANGRFPTSNTNPLNHVESLQYDVRTGAVTQLTDPNGLITKWQYDSLGRKTREIRPDGTQTRWDYVVCNGSCAGNGGTNTAFYYVQETPLASDGATANGAWRKTYFDVFERPIRNETQGFNASDIIVTLMQYDVLGRSSASSRPYYNGQTAYWTTTSFDILDRTIQVTEPNGSKTTTSYNGLKTANTNDKNQTTAKIRNSQNQIVQIIDALGQALQLAYDPFGNLALTTDVAGNQIFNQYDNLGHKLSTRDPDMGTWTYQYDGFGQMVQQIDAKSQSTTFSYDALGRMTRRGEPDLVSTWVYDTCSKGIGKLCQSTSDNGYSHTLSYDNLGRPAGGSTVLDNTYTVANTFDVNGRVISQTYPTGFAVNYSYNATGYLTEVKNAQSGQRYWQANSMDAEGHLLLQTYGASHVVEQRYNNQTGRIDKILAGAGNGLLNLSYQHDTIGNLTNRTDGNLNVVENFLYDNLNRLTFTQGSGIPTIEYRYNGIGNITYRSDVGSYSYANSRPHAIAAVAGTVNASFSYDANGNQISGNGRTITVASYNLPTNIQKGSWADNFLYGPEHQRIKQTNNAGTIYYLNPDNAGGLLYEKEIKANGTVEYKHYITAAGQAVALYTQRSTGQNDLKYWFKDYQGSLTTITDEAGTVVERLGYEAFGKRRYPNGQPDPANQITGQTTDRGYTGHEHLDEVGLIHMNGRVYDPLLARFIIPDPTVPSAEWMQDFNRYSYVTNNPFAYTDPTGFGEAGGDIDSCGDCSQPVHNDSGGYWGTGDGSPLTSQSWSYSESSSSWSSFRESGGLRINGVSDSRWNMVASINLSPYAVAKEFSNAKKIAQMMHLSSAEFALDTAASVSEILAAWGITTFKGVPIDYLKNEMLSPGRALTTRQNSIILGLASIVSAPAPITEQLVVSAERMAAKSTGKTFFRSMSKAEAEAVSNTGKLRGGKPGETFFTDSRFRSAERAQDRLSLPGKPQVQMEFRITNNPALERNGTRVVPDFGGRGGGREYMSRDAVNVEIINVQPY